MKEVKDKGRPKARLKWGLWEYFYAILSLFTAYLFVTSVVSGSYLAAFCLIATAANVAFLVREQKIRLGEW